MIAKTTMLDCVLILYSEDGLEIIKNLHPNLHSTNKRPPFEMKYDGIAHQSSCMGMLNFADVIDTIILWFPTTQLLTVPASADGCACSLPGRWCS